MADLPFSNKAELTDIIIVDDEQIIRDSLRQLFELEGYQVHTYTSALTALDRINRQFPGIVITDINMPHMDGLSLLEQITALDSELPVILLTGYADVPMAVQAMHKGAYDFVEKPVNETLPDTVSRALEKRRLVLENRQLKDQLRQNKEPGVRILGDTPVMQEMMSLLNAVVDTPADVLIHGETGTGKELVARFLHEHSHRAQANFVALNCAAIPENLIESELFGVRKGAYTGAEEHRAGKFEFAHQGTLFLDEIEATPLSLQIKLLRVLEERKVTPVGSNEAIDLDIRIIAATKTDLLQQADLGDFRHDLYYRLNLVKVDIPPLRARKADIPLLFKHFSSIAANRFHKSLLPLDSNQLQQLISYDWPGNVRELRNTAERHVLLGTDIQLSSSATSPAFSEDLSLSEKVAFYEQSLLEDALQQTSGSVKQALEILRLPRKTFYDKMAKYGLERSRYTRGNN
ncbi:sigma-54-dependent transcriptional regulator [Oceanospirillum sediminis]|uniref:Sigma-54-dependent Fis family transcriptional regulator n=1 Tax=Oceanospirillum sediminis TaxID=2760088 RepID=A0A839IUF4_9GAMM|nr:sigma-54 dependent transcriptional regulator [Oceanospirillum sediminis]MBB1488578.1 sigma-54-dependent Fis family transcriptional regulator [Oceanospirillum sediminis]